MPFLAFAAIRNNPDRCAHVVSANEFLADARSGELPNYSFYTPNMFDDGHDTSLGTATAWLQRFVRDLEGTIAMRERTVLVITWDEGSSHDNRVLTLLIGNVVKPGRVTTSLTHYSLLRAVEDNFDLRPLGPGDSAADSFPESVWRR
jgi:acid phosphatase